MSSPAKSGPPNDPPKPPPKAPMWLNVVWPAGLLVTALLVFPGSSRKTTSLTLTAWKAKVDANQVKTASIDTSGKVRIVDERSRDLG